MTKTRSIQSMAAAAGVALALFAAAGSAQARSDVNWSIGLSSPGVVVGVGNGYPVYSAPVYSAPAPVYYAPRPVYQAAPPFTMRPQRLCTMRRPHPRPTTTAAVATAITTTATAVVVAGTADPGLTRP